MKAALLFIVLVASSPAQPIELTDIKGRTITAEVLGIFDGSVSVQKEDKKVSLIPLANLSPESRANVETLFPKAVVVKWKATKRVEGKFRYFFDIRNHTGNPWQGKVKVTLMNQMEGVTNGTQSFQAEKPIDPGLGTVVFIDAFTGPPAIHGEASVVGFSYTVATGEKTEASKTGKIPDKITE